MGLDNPAMPARTFRTLAGFFLAFAILLGPPAAVSAPAALLLQNQVTGAFSVFRRELLGAALPFPRVNAAERASISRVKTTLLITPAQPKLRCDSR